MITLLLLHLLIDYHPYHQEQHKLPKSILFYTIAGQTLDVATTAYKFSGEANHLLPSNLKGIVIVKAAFTGVESYAIYKSAKNHPKLSKILGIAVGTSGFIPGFINIHRINHK